ARPLRDLSARRLPVLVVYSSRRGGPRHVRLPRRSERASTRLRLAQIPLIAGFQRVSARTLGEVKDKGKGAENLIWLASRQSGRADPSLLADDAILAALTGRLADLDARVTEKVAEVDPDVSSVASLHRGARRP